MQKHISILGALYIACGLLFLLGAGILFVVITGGGLLSGDREAIAITGMVGTALSLMLAVFSLPAMLAGYGILRRRPWGRIVAMVVGAMNLLNVPIGTALGIYTLWVMTRPEVEAIYHGYTSEVATAQAV